MTKPQKNALEWVVFAASAIIIVAVAGQLAVSAIRETKSPPVLHTIAEAPQPLHGGGARVDVEVRNAGDQTAEQVKVEVVLERDGNQIERAELDFLFVPRKSSRRGSVIFRKNPEGCTVVARPMSYETP